MHNKKHKSRMIFLLIPLGAKQGGINFTPFVLSFPYAKKKKKKIN